MKCKHLFFFLFFSLFLQAGEKGILIPLATRHFFSSIFVPSFESKDVPKEYLSSLHSILTFDLDQSGHCRVTDAKGYDYKVEVIASKKILSALLHPSQKGSIKEVGSYPLSGALNLDRSAIHQLADDLIHSISKTPGIARSKILYSIQMPTGAIEGPHYQSEIWEIDYDGENKRQVTRENHYCITPVCFPPIDPILKNQFLYVNYKNGQPKIYLGSLDKESGTPLVSLRGNQLLPAISRRGNLIAFISDAGGRADLFIQLFSPSRGLVGKPIQLYSHPKSVQASPTFNPDGKRIAFVSDKDGTPHIYLIKIPDLRNRERAHPVQLSKKFRHNTCPNWSPDGTKLAYSAMIDGNRQIMVYDFLTKEEIQLTTGKSHKENPSWAPNSLHLVYNTVGVSSELFIINLKQKEPVQITSGPGKKHYPSWEPMRESL